MTYAQQLPDNTWRELDGSVKFSEYVYQTAESLTSEQRTEFSVYEIVEMQPPTLNWNQQLSEPVFTKVGNTVEKSWNIRTTSDYEQHLYRVAIATQIKQLRDDKMQNGGFPAAGKWFHSDTFSRTQHMGLERKGTSLPPGIFWKTMDGSYIEITPAIATEVFENAVVQDLSLFTHAEYLIAQVMQAEDPSSVSIDSGWPPTYTE